MASKCKYCGSTSYGFCSASPYKVHEHTGDQARCVYCGSTSYGFCATSPVKKHKLELTRFRGQVDVLVL